MATSPKSDKPAWHFGQKHFVVLFFILISLPLLGVLAFATFQPIQVLPRISLAPGFSFTDENGERLTNEDLRGSLTLYNFTYTDCGEGCLATGPVMKDVQEMVAGMDTGGIPFQQVTVSFDPERDTPERLLNYAESLDADRSTWHFATGEPTRLKNVIGGGFSAFYNKEDDGDFKFDPMFVLVDGWGIIRAKYRTGAPELEIIERDINMIVEEANNSEGASRIAYEAAHLFLCYPD